MVVQILKNDLIILKQKYKCKMSYYDKKINNCIEPYKEKYFFKQYIEYKKALDEVNLLLILSERTKI